MLDTGSLARDNKAAIIESSESARVSLTVARLGTEEVEATATQNSKRPLIEDILEKMISRLLRIYVP